MTVFVNNTGTPERWDIHCPDTVPKWNFAFTTNQYLFLDLQFKIINPFMYGNYEFWSPILTTLIFLIKILLIHISKYICISCRRFFTISF